MGNRNMKKVVIVNFIVFLSLVFSACSTQTQTPEKQNTQNVTTKETGTTDDESSDLVYRQYAFGKKFFASSEIEEIGKTITDSVENPDKLIILKNDQIYKSYDIAEVTNQTITLSDEAYYCFIVIDTSKNVVDITDEVNCNVVGSENGIIELK